MADYTLNDCLTECARIETGVSSCISAMNSVGLSTPNDASLGILPHYFGCDSLIGGSLPTKEFANINDASAAITLVNTNKNNLKTIINRFCKPYNIAITDQTIDYYYTYIAAVSGVTIPVEYITNLHTNAYIDLGYSLDRTYKMSAELSWASMTSNEYYNILFGSQIHDSVGYRIYGFTSNIVNDNNVARYRFLAHDYGVADYIGGTCSLNTKVVFEDCYATEKEEGGVGQVSYTKTVYGTYNSDYQTRSVLWPQIYAPGDIGTNCRIFNNTGNCPTNSRFYSGKIYNNNGVLIHNYIPVIVWQGCDWAAGVKDTITNQYFYNSGSGTITYGPIITN